MAAKLDTRMSRAYSFTFDEDGDKERFHKQAKRQGRTLAGLIKYLLERDAATDRAVPPATPATGAPAGAAGVGGRACRGQTSTGQDSLSLPRSLP